MGFSVGALGYGFLQWLVRQSGHDTSSRSNRPATHTVVADVVVLSWQHDRRRSGQCVRVTEVNKAKLL